MINNGITIGVIKPASGGTGEIPGLSDVLAVSNRELKYIQDAEYYFAVGDETKELVLMGLPENPISIYTVTENLPLGSELIINAYQTSAKLGYGDMEVVYAYNGQFLQLGDNEIEIPFGSKCIIRNVESEDFFFVSIIEKFTEKISPLYEVLGIGDRTLNATFGNNLPLSLPEITLYGNSKNDHIVFTNENLNNDLLIKISTNLFDASSGGVLKITNSSDFKMSLKAIDGVIFIADKLDIPKNCTAIIKYIYLVLEESEFNQSTFQVSFETNIVENRKAIYRVTSQDNTGLIDVIKVRNDFSELLESDGEFELDRENVGSFSCNLFNPEKHIIYSRNAIGRLVFSPEDNIILSVDKDYNPIDNHFEFGGFFIIEELIR